MEEQYFPHVRTRKRTAAKDEEYYRLRLEAAFGRKRLNQITRREIQLCHSKLNDDGLAPATCNHYLKLMKRAFNLAIQWEVVDGPNPAVGIQQFRELNQVENYLDDEQLRRLLAVLKKDKNRTVCGIVLFLLSTGARLNEALQARWSLIDIEHRVWRIPATNSKSGKVRAVPLNDAALEVLSKQDTEGEFEHVFINLQTGLPYTTIQKVWERLRRKAGLEHVRIHDLRHSYASMLVNSGRSLYEVQQILGHSNPKVTQRYSHLSTATLQDAAGSAADRISEALKKAS
jgi:integrase